MHSELINKIENSAPMMTETLCELVSFPAISPLSGGTGEFRKANFLAEKIKSLGFNDVKIMASPDPDAENGERPNVIVRVPGRSTRRLWIIAHIDVVPAGDLSLWETDPFTGVVKDGRIFGRGTSDNGQEAVASLYALYALKELGITPEYEVCLAFVADEEVGSKHGIQYLINNGLFNKEDLIVVPDMGSEDGSIIEIAEKSICWIAFTCEGQQVHASMPHLGNNACRAANEFSVSLDRALHAAFPDTNALFMPPCSTFEPTQRRANVSGINIIPGVEHFAFDCRILPGIKFDDVFKVVNTEIKRAEEKYRVKIAYECPQIEEAAELTDENSDVVDLLAEAIKTVYPKIKPKFCGFGGGTCGAFFRRAGIHTAVWRQEADVAHMPNEYAVIEHMVNEAKVFALIMTGNAQ